MRLRMLTIHDAVKDYVAVMESEERLRTVFVPSGTWPVGLTLEQNIADLGWHQTEFRMRTSFAYTVVSLDEAEVLGCLYIYPTSVAGFDAKITMWVREGQVEHGLDDHLFQTVCHWIEEAWPFENPAYPGRTISFEEWRAMNQDA